MYLRNCWYLAGWSADFDVDDIAALKILEQPIVLYRTSGTGELVALEDRCSHRAAPLSKGRREGDDLRCMYHGVRFGPSGACTDLPGQDVIPKAVCVRSFPTVERHGGAWVWMGEADKADPALIPQFIGPDSDEFAIAASCLEIDAEAQLLIDNLLDVSHASYVHEATFGVGDKKTVRTMIEGEFDANVQPIDRGVRIDRWHLGRTKNPWIAGMESDDFIVNEVVVPGVFTLRVRCYPMGVQDREGGSGLPIEATVFERSIGQIVTPVAPGQCKLFYAVGPVKSHAELKDKVFEIATIAFREDEDIIVAQQRVIAASPDRPMLTVGMDGPHKRYEAIVRKLSAAE